jgi:hypothetical protein
MVWRGMIYSIMVLCYMKGIVWFGMAWHGVVWYGLMRYIKIWYGNVLTTVL